MNRLEFDDYVLNTYLHASDNPWMDAPNFKVYRHVDNKKWFAIVMDIPRNKLSLNGDEIIDVVNFKCDPTLIPSLIKEPGIFRAYHMNKSKWISVLLDGSVSSSKIKELLDISYNLTKSMKKKLSIPQDDMF